MSEHEFIAIPLKLQDGHSRKVVDANGNLFANCIHMEHAEAIVTALNSRYALIVELKRATRELREYLDGKTTADAWPKVAELLIKWGDEAIAKAEGK